MKQEVTRRTNFIGRQTIYVAFVHEDMAGRYVVWQGVKCYLNNKNEYGFDMIDCCVVRLPDEVTS